MDDNINNNTDKILDVEIVSKMKTSYIDYAMSVIVSRALPDVRDGLKPVHRRILHSMNELNMGPNSAHKKSARIVGDTMGKYHPHGDAAIYDALVRMGQNFSMRYPLIDGHGNFGNIDGYQAAAMRYTEARLSKIALEMLEDMDEETVDFVDNYDGELREPSVLPSRFPNLLINGSSGIAVGMATNIPPHNLSEVIDGLDLIIDNRIEDRDTDIKEIMSVIKGPDFPTGASILGRNGIKQAYLTGRGKIQMRSNAEIETLPSGRQRIVVTEIPYQVNKAKMIEKIADLVKEKKIEGIADLNDASGREDGIKIVIDCKRDANANVILNRLYKYSQLQEAYSINFLAIVDGEPKTLNIKEILNYYLDFQEDFVTRRTKRDLAKAEKRAHILEGYLKAIDNIDEVINIIRTSKSVDEERTRLMTTFGFSEEQVKAIVEMRLRSLRGLEREKILDELNKLQIRISELREILADKKVLLSLLKKEFAEVKEKFGDERRTKIIDDPGEIDIEDLIHDEMSVITMTYFNYAKRCPLSTYKSQNRGGKGIIGMQTREDDVVRGMFLASNHTTILFFTNEGRVYKLKTYEIPEAGRNAKGTPIVNMIPLGSDEKVTAILTVKDIDENSYFTMITKKGIIKRVKAEAFKNIRKGGLIAVGLRENDRLMTVIKTDGNRDLIVATKSGMAIRFNENDCRSMGRSAGGVKAVNLKGDDIVIGMEAVEDDKKLLIVSEKGYGKLTLTDKFKRQSRGGMGLKAYRITPKTGDIAGISMVNENEELMLINSEGVIIRIRVKDISTLDRNTSGVKLIDVGEDVRVMSIAKISEDAIEAQAEEIMETDEITENAEAEEADETSENETTED
ncbi:MAG: DNA gyrase subunit A [Clostridiales bacterium]|nr:DNA gyrase subunit A [Clostridiales bacterium]